MKQKKKIIRRLAVSILCMLLCLASPLLTFAYTQGEVNSFTVEIQVQVTGVFDSKVQLEQVEGPRTVLPVETEITPAADGRGNFSLTYADANNGEVFKYKITEVAGTDRLVTYNTENKAYICEVWIFEENDTKYARAFLYESDTPLDMTAEVNANVPKLDSCVFVNTKANASDDPNDPDPKDPDPKDPDPKDPDPKDSDPKDPDKNDPEKKPTITPTVTPGGTSRFSLSNIIKTGDTFRALPYLLALAGAVVVLLLILAARRKRRKDDEEDGE